MRYLGYYLLAFLAVGIMSCGNYGAESKPALSQKAMVPIVYELMLSEEYNRMLYSKDSSLRIDSMSLYKFGQVFSLHKTNREDFSASYTYYLGHPDMLKAIYDSINALVNRRRIEIMHPNFKRGDKGNDLPRKLNKDSLK